MWIEDLSYGPIQLVLPQGLDRWKRQLVSVLRDGHCLLTTLNEGAGLLVFWLGCIKITGVGYGTGVAPQSWCSEEEGQRSDVSRKAKSGRKHSDGTVMARLRVGPGPESSVAGKSSERLLSGHPPLTHPPARSPPGKTYSG